MHGCTQQAKARAYTSLVRPHLETCAPVWTPHGEMAREQLEKVQRWICGARWDKTLHQWTKHHEECRSTLGLLTIQQRHHLLLCCQVYKIVNKLDYIDFDQYFTFNSSITRRESFCINVLPSRINSYRYSFFVNAPFVWNTLPSSVVTSTSLPMFKSKLKSLLHTNCS